MIGLRTSESRAFNVPTTITPQGGTMSASATYSFRKKGRKVFVEAQAVIDSTGTATGVVDVNIPFIPARNTALTAVNFTSSLGLAGYVHNNGGQGQLRFFLPNGTTAIAVGTFYLAAEFFTP